VVISDTRVTITGLLGRRLGVRLLPDLVLAMRNMCSTDPRDRIFGMTGLEQTGEMAGFGPDYSVP
jgi:hypothetical protein